MMMWYTFAVSDLKTVNEIIEHFHGRNGYDCDLFVTDSRSAAVRNLHDNAFISPVQIIKRLDNYRRDGRTAAGMFTLAPVITKEDYASRDPYSEMQVLKPPVHKFVKREYKKMKLRGKAKSMYQLNEIDTQANTDNIPLPTPEELMRMLSKSQPSLIVPIDISRTTFNRNSAYRRSFHEDELESFQREQRKPRRRRRRRTITGLPGHISMEIDDLQVGSRLQDTLRDRPKTTNFESHEHSPASFIDKETIDYVAKVERRFRPRTRSDSRYASIRRCNSLPRLRRKKEIDEQAPFEVAMPRISRTLSDPRLNKQKCTGSSQYIGLPRSVSFHGKDKTWLASSKIRPRSMEVLDFELAEYKGETGELNSMPNMYETDSSTSSLRIANLSGRRRTGLPPAHPQSVNVQLRQSKNKINKEDRRSSSGNWSGSSDSARQSMDSDFARSVQSPDKDSALSLNTDPEEEEERAETPTQDSSETKSVTSSATDSTAVASVINKDFTQMDTDEWLKSLVQRATGNADNISLFSSDDDTSSTATGPPSSLTEQNLRAHDALEVLEDIGHNCFEDDDFSSVHSLDEDGFFTSFHTDSGLVRSVSSHFLRHHSRDDLSEKDQKEMNRLSTYSNFSIATVIENTSYRSDTIKKMKTKSMEAIADDGASVVSTASSRKSKPPPPRRESSLQNADTVSQKGDIDNQSIISYGADTISINSNFSDLEGSVISESGKSSGKVELRKGKESNSRTKSNSSGSHHDSSSSFEFDSLDSGSLSNFSVSSHNRITTKTAISTSAYPSLCLVTPIPSDDESSRYDDSHDADEDSMNPWRLRDEETEEDGEKTPIVERSPSPEKVWDDLKSVSKKLENDLEDPLSDTTSEKSLTESIMEELSARGNFVTSTPGEIGVKETDIDADLNLPVSKEKESNQTIISAERTMSYKAATEAEKGSRHLSTFIGNSSSSNAPTFSTFMSPAKTVVKSKIPTVMPNKNMDMSISSENRNSVAAPETWNKDSTVVNAGIRKTSDTIGFHSSQKECPELSSFSPAKPKLVDSVPVKSTQANSSGLNASKNVSIPRVNMYELNSDKKDMNSVPTKPVNDSPPPRPPKTFVWVGQATLQAEIEREESKPVLPPPRRSSLNNTGKRPTSSPLPPPPRGSSLKTDEKSPQSTAESKRNSAPPDSYKKLTPPDSNRRSAPPASLPVVSPYSSSRVSQIVSNVNSTSSPEESSPPPPMGSLTRRYPLSHYTGSVSPSTSVTSPATPVFTGSPYSNYNKQNTSNYANQSAMDSQAGTPVWNSFSTFKGPSPGATPTGPSPSTTPTSTLSRRSSTDSQMSQPTYDLARLFGTGSMASSGSSIGSLSRSSSYTSYGDYMDMSACSTPHRMSPMSGISGRPSPGPSPSTTPTNSLSRSTGRSIRAQMENHYMPHNPKVTENTYMHQMETTYMHHNIKQMKPMENPYMPSDPQNRPPTERTFSYKAATKPDNYMHVGEQSQPVCSAAPVSTNPGSRQFSTAVERTMSYKAATKGDNYMDLGPGPVPEPPQETKNRNADIERTVSYRAAMKSGYGRISPVGPNVNKQGPVRVSCGHSPKSGPTTPRSGPPTPTEVSPSGGNFHARGRPRTAAPASQNGTASVPDKYMPTITVTAKSRDRSRSPSVERVTLAPGVKPGSRSNSLERKQTQDNNANTTKPDQNNAEQKSSNHDPRRSAIYYQAPSVNLTSLRMKEQDNPNYPQPQPANHVAQSQHIRAPGQANGNVRAPTHVNMNAFVPNGSVPHGSVPVQKPRAAYDPTSSHYSEQVRAAYDRLKGVYRYYGQQPTDPANRPFQRIDNLRRSFKSYQQSQEVPKIAQGNKAEMAQNESYNPEIRVSSKDKSVVISNPAVMPHNIPHAANPRLIGASNRYSQPSSSPPFPGLPGSRPHGPMPAAAVVNGHTGYDQQKMTAKGFKELLTNVQSTVLGNQTPQQTIRPQGPKIMSTQVKGPVVSVNDIANAVAKQHHVHQRNSTGDPRVMNGNVHSNVNLRPRSMSHEQSKLEQRKSYGSTDNVEAMAVLHIIDNIKHSIRQINGEEDMSGNEMSPPGKTNQHRPSIQGKSNHNYPTVNGNPMLSESKKNLLQSDGVKHTAV